MQAEAVSQPDPVPESVTNELLAISPLDGRYRKHVQELATSCSEFGLIHRRTIVEVRWLLFLINDLKLVPGITLSETQIRKVLSIQENFDSSDAARIRAIERTINHDVKAVEYFVKESLESHGMSDLKEYVHFACTSEDINNLAYAMMLRDVRRDTLLPHMTNLMRALVELAARHVATPMLSRTHGQTASPTTLGKELINVAARLLHWAETYQNVTIQAKMNGAVGNFNAHVVASPEIDWPTASASFIGMLGFTANPYTTQIEPHDWIAEYLNAIVGFNQTLLDFVRDIWGYIALGYFKQRPMDGEVGSSTMPHKVNPIDFENAEGNIGVGNAIARHLADKLQVSRWQRDLSDSTVLRNVGAVFGYTAIAIRNTLRGLHKLDVDRDQIESDLEDAWEVLSEALQTVMRKHGLPNPYETVKAITRGRQFDEGLFFDMLDSLQVPSSVRTQLQNLQPNTYIGLSQQLAETGIDEINRRLEAL